MGKIILSIILVTLSIFIIFSSYTLAFFSEQKNINEFRIETGEWDNSQNYEDQNLSDQTLFQEVTELINPESDSCKKIFDEILALLITKEESIIMKPSVDQISSNQEYYSETILEENYLVQEYKIEDSNIEVTVEKQPIVI